MPGLLADGTGGHAASHGSVHGIERCRMVPIAPATQTSLLLAQTPYACPICAPASVSTIHVHAGGASQRSTRPLSPTIHRCCPSGVPATSRSESVTGLVCKVAIDGGDTCLLT
jgi:hypothetical protein